MFKRYCKIGGTQMAGMKTLPSDFNTFFIMKDPFVDICTNWNDPNLIFTICVYTTDLYLLGNTWEKPVDQQVLDMQYSLENVVHCHSFSSFFRVLAASASAYFLVMVTHNTFDQEGNLKL
jgi:hypothetical protein